DRVDLAAITDLLFAGPGVRLVTRPTTRAPPQALTDLRLTQAVTLATASATSCPSCGCNDSGIRWIGAEMLMAATGRCRASRIAAATDAMSARSSPEFFA